MSVPPATHTLHLLPTADLPADLSADEALLDAADRARARALRQPADRARHVRSRALLRRLLSAQAPWAPQDWRFVTGPHGKPQCDPAMTGPGPDGRHLPQFNIAHTEGLVAVALGWDAAVGVDVEPLRPLQDVQALAAVVLTPDERRRWDALPADGLARSHALLLHWTLKEALAKALGLGFAGLAPDGIGLRPAPHGDGWQPQAVTAEAAGWLRDWPPQARLRTALTATGHRWALAVIPQLPVGGGERPVPPDTVCVALDAARA